MAYGEFPMSRQQLIEAIRERNHTAAEAFLTTFADGELKTYLRRLTEIQGRRGRGSVWIREIDAQTTAPAAR